MKNFILVVMLMCLPFLAEARVYHHRSSHHHTTTTNHVMRNHQMNQMVHRNRNHQEHHNVARRPQHTPLYHNCYRYTPYMFNYMLIMQHRHNHTIYRINKDLYTVKRYDDNFKTYLYYYNEYGTLFAVAVITAYDIPYTRACDIIVHSSKYFKGVDEEIYLDINKRYGVKEFNTYLK